MLFRDFARDRRGNVSQIFALAIIPAVGFVGAAVDYSRAGMLRSGMQSALDATALYLSKEAATLTAAQLTTRAQELFKTGFSNPEAKNLVVTASYASTETGWSVKVGATASVDTTLARVLGQTSINIGGNSEAVWGIKKLELALALDNTGSMSSSSKMTELKKAAKDLLNTLKAAAKKPEDIRVSIIPFATDVNIGKSNANATWLNWSDWESDNGSYDYTCTGSGWNRTCSYVWSAANRNTWNGCVTDRNQDHDTLDTAPTSATTNFYPHQASNCPVELMPLTNNWNNLTSKIDSMTPTGNTNVTIGLVWAWHSLTASLPLTEALAPASDLDKVIILLTDGDNTQNRWSSSQTSIDNRTKKACDNIKGTGIKLYTIRVIDGNATLLKGCASNSSMFFDVQTASQLSGTFSQIAKNLANLRLAK